MSLETTWPALRPLRSPVTSSDEDWWAGSGSIVSMGEHALGPLRAGQAPA